MSSIEQKLFSWKEWDLLATSVLCFYNCKLLKDIADVPKNTEINAIVCDHQTSRIELLFDDSGKNYRVFQLSYDIGEEITDQVKEERDDVKR